MARRCLMLLASALLLAPASAHADFSETPTYDFTGEPSCMAPTGAPGEVAIGSTSGARFLQATRTGFVPAGEIKAGEGFSCGSIASRPSGAGVIAGTQFYGDSVVAVVRDPGGTWGTPVAVASRDGWQPQTVIGAVSDRGDVAVTWVEERSRPEPAIRVRIAQRAPGGAFGPAKVVQTSTGMAYPRAIDAAVSSTGEAIVTWTAVDVSGKGQPRVEANVATVAPDGTVSAPAALAIDSSSSTSLSVAGDGRALLTYVSGGRVTYIERAPGAAFATPVKLAKITDPASGIAIGRLHDSGAAAIAWAGNLFNEVRIATRPGHGGFRAPVTVAKAQKLPAGYDPIWYSPAFLDMAGGGVAFSNVFYDDSLVLTEDGRALLGLSAFSYGGDERSVARLATIPLAGGAAVGAGAGGEFDTPSLTQPLVLADGSPALTWVTGVSENHFTLHLATEGGTRPPAGPAPRLKVGAPVKRVLDFGDSLRLPIDCSGPCSVRARISGNAGSEGITTLARGGKGQLRISPGLKSIAGKRGGTVRILLRYGAPGAVLAQTQTQTVAVKVKRAQAPMPRIIGLKAVRRGDGVRVTWRMKHTPAELPVIVSGSVNRDDRSNPLVLTAEFIERSRSSYTVVLRPADRVRYVTLRPFFDDRLPARTTVKVR